MKAVAVFPKRQLVRTVEHDEPELTAPTEVLLEMLEVGVCGTDKEICSFQYGTPPAESDYLVLGHESLARVAEVGGEVGQFQPGDLVVPSVRRPCHHDHCPACRVDRQDFCFTGDFTERGIKQRHGFLAERIVEDQRYLNLVPGELREVAVLIEPLTVAEKALRQIWDVQQRLPWATPESMDRPQGYRWQALVLGAGPVGLLGAMALAGRGFETYVYSREPVGGPRSKIVEALGGTFVSASETSIEQLAEMISSIDLVYEATGASGLCFEVLKYLGTNGVFVFTGVPGRKAPIEVETDLIMRNLVLKNQVVFGTVNAGQPAFEHAAEDLRMFMRRWPDAVAGLITAHYPLDGFEELLRGEAPGIKNVIQVAA
ncbi:MAG: glucose 1-dehydrogenase [Planctomycetota bacterium]|nr:glucose 1-dehydrogenase [Planctomycetota bacterium]